MQAKCPGCQAPLAYDSKFLGKRFKCATCLRVVEINKQGIPQMVAPNVAIAQAFKPAPADSHPIRYKCKHCKAVLETDASLGMKEEACPLCKKVNHVPPSREQKREQKEREKAIQRQFKGQHQREEAVRRAETVPQATPGAAAQQPVAQSSPPRQNRPARTLSSDEILDQYRKVPKSASMSIAGRAGNIFARPKALARAMRLNHEVGGLTAAIEGQWEALGMLMLQHRPAGMDLTARLAELSRVQADLAAQQVTLDALRRTKGSGPAVKEAERDVRLLREEQRQIMIGVGRDAESGKADAPGASGHFGALNALRSTLASREAELATIEEQVGPASGLAPAGGCLAQVGTVVSLPLGLLLVVFFFLPWVSIRCEGHQVASASGLQLSVGQVTITSDEVSTEDASKDLHAKPWFALGLIIPVGLLAAAGMTLAGRIAPRRLGRYLILAGLTGLLLMILAANVNYSQDSASEKDVVVKTEATGVLIASGLLYVLGILCGLANLFLPAIFGKSPPMLSDGTMRRPPP